jgi:hypothetical protein
MPAREEWDRVSPIMEYRLTTRKTPIQGQIMDIMKDTSRAF